MIERLRSLTSSDRGGHFSLGACAIAALVSVAVTDPHRSRALLPRCPTKLLTGLDCPACGGLRLTYDLLHGDLRAAAHDNPFLLVSSPLLALLSWRSWRETGQPGIVAAPRWAAYSLAGTALAWMLVRNLPTWPLKPTIA